MIHIDTVDQYNSYYLYMTYLFVTMAFDILDTLSTCSINLSTTSTGQILVRTYTILNQDEFRPYILFCTYKVTLLWLARLNVTNIKYIRFH